MNINKDSHKLPFYTDTGGRNNRFWHTESNLPEDGEYWARSMVAFFRNNPDFVNVNMLHRMVTDMVKMKDVNSEKAASFFMALQKMLIESDIKKQPKKRVIRKPKTFTISDVARETNVRVGSVISYMANNEWVDPDTLEPTKEVIDRGLAHLPAKAGDHIKLTQKGFSLLKDKSVIYR